MVGDEPGTPGDHSDATVLSELQQLVLASEPARDRLAALAQFISGPGCGAEVIGAPDDPDPVLRCPAQRMIYAPGPYREAVERLARDLDGHLAPGELDLIAQELAGDPDAEPMVCTYLTTGHHRLHARDRDPFTLEVVAKSLEFRAAGAGAIEADDRASGWAKAEGKGVVPRQAVTKYRQRLRDTRNASGHDALANRWY